MVPRLLSGCRVQRLRLKHDFMDLRVIDADKPVPEATWLLIGGESHYAEGAASGEQALARLKEEPFEAVLLDVNLGRENGLEVLSEILKNYPNLPVVMFTAHRADLEEARAGTSARSRAAGFAAVLAKPFDLDELLAAVRQAVGAGAV